jgi:hypothetical protein
MARRLLTLLLFLVLPREANRRLHMEPNIWILARHRLN